jgi:hypothetical protein
VIQENEAVTLLLSVGVAIFIAQNRSRLTLLPYHRLVIGSFLVLLAARILTILEGYCYEEILNFAEHICYSISVLQLAVWTWLVMGKGVRES